MRANEKVVKALATMGLSLSLIISGGYLVAPWEGKVNKVYLDPVNILTSCFGHTGSELKIGQHFTDDQCYEQLAEDLVEAQADVHNLVKVPINTYQEAALISFAYNVGGPKFAKSTMLKKFNSKDYEGGCEELMRWVYADGKKLNGLVSRRTDEKKVCLGDKDTLKFINDTLSKEGADVSLIGE